MSKDIKRRVGWFLAWNYDSEEEALNEQSKQGWRLNRAHAFSQVYERDSISYRYRIDYNPMSNMSEDEKGRYVGTFEEMGWRYVCSAAYGWNYFEKPVLPGNTEEDYQIYTDNSSLKEALTKWIRLARILEILCIVISIVNLSAGFAGRPVNLLSGCTTAVEALMFEFGARSMKKKWFGKTSSKGNVIVGNILFLAMIGLFITNIVGSIKIFTNEDILNTKYQGNYKYLHDGYADAEPFTIESSGRYDVDVYAETEFGKIVFSIYKGPEVVYTTSGNVIDIDETLKLEKGLYRAEMALDFGSAEVEDCFYSVNVKID